MVAGRKLRLLLTADNSHTLYDEILDESYHSHKGAVGESTYVFIEMGLAFVCNRDSRRPLSVLEVGFGTGLNAWLTWRFAQSEACEIRYHGLEPFPIEYAIANKLNYETKDKAKFLELHASEWRETQRLDKNFRFLKEQVRIEDLQAIQPVNIIYWDAFAPSKQEDIWSIQNLRKCYNYLTEGGVLVTYCAQGQFKRDLKAVGFQVEVLPGALGKKEMVRAHKLS